MSSFYEVKYISSQNFENCLIFKISFWFFIFWKTAPKKYKADSDILLLILAYEITPRENKSKLQKIRLTASWNNTSCTTFFYSSIFLKSLFYLLYLAILGWKNVFDEIFIYLLKFYWLFSMNV
jgi:hypothetical protein